MRSTRKTPVLEARFPLEDLRVEELEPRLEFSVAPDFCGPAYRPAEATACSYCYYEILPDVYQEVPCR